MTRSNSLTASILPARLVLLSLTEADAATTETSALGEVLWYPTTGCGGAIVHTALPGKQFTDTQLAMPAGLSSLHETAAALHVTWETSVVCTPSGRTHELKPDSVSFEASAASTLPQPIFANRTDDISEVQADGVVNGYNSTNWSGYQINNTGQYVQGGWTVPTASKSNPNWSNAGYSSSMWSGIGGGVGASTIAPLIQAGTEHVRSNENVGTYYFRYDIVKSPTDTTLLCELAGENQR